MHQAKNKEDAIMNNSDPIDGEGDLVLLSDSSDDDEGFHSVPAYLLLETSDSDDDKKDDDNKNSGIIPMHCGSKQIVSSNRSEIVPARKSINEDNTNVREIMLLILDEFTEKLYANMELFPPDETELGENNGKKRKRIFRVNEIIENSKRRIQTRVYLDVNQGINDLLQCLTQESERYPEKLVSYLQEVSRKYLLKKRRSKNMILEDRDSAQRLARKMFWKKRSREIALPFSDFDAHVRSPKDMSECLETLEQVMLLSSFGKNSVCYEYPNSSLHPKSNFFHFPEYENTEYQIPEIYRFGTSLPVVDNPDIPCDHALGDFQNEILDNVDTMHRLRILMKEIKTEQKAERMKKMNGSKQNETPDEVLSTPSKSIGKQEQTRNKDDVLNMRLNKSDKKADADQDLVIRLNEDKCTFLRYQQITNLEELQNNNIWGEERSRACLLESVGMVLYHSGFVNAKRSQLEILSDACARFIQHLSVQLSALREVPNNSRNDDNFLIDSLIQVLSNSAMKGGLSGLIAYKDVELTKISSTLRDMEQEGEAMKKLLRLDNRDGNEMQEEKSNIDKIQALTTKMDHDPANFTSDQAPNQSKAEMSAADNQYETDGLDLFANSGELKESFRVFGTISKNIWIDILDLEKPLPLDFVEELLSRS